ncbi:hypothetical protein ABT084_08515 [Streptomyces sp. NPDC002138]|uniref:hypothetical protein n=1 Tax=Streptomyces sp. NPDC002138 TaxID=3154410 RepID=UPI0033229B73
MARAVLSQELWNPGPPQAARLRFQALAGRLAPAGGRSRASAGRGRRSALRNNGIPAR